MLSCEGIGKNIEQAIENALLKLRAPREDVDIKILDEGGFFRKAKVLVSISEDCVEKYEKIQENREKLIKEDLAEEQKHQGELKEQEEKAKAPHEELKNESAKHDEKPEPQEEGTPVKAKENINANDLPKAKAFVEGLLKQAGIQADITSEENKDEVFLNLVGASEVIGFRGEGLNAIQYLTNVYVGKNNRHAKKVRVDCDNYRAKREDTLIALANRMARKVAKMNHPVRLEPMTANERRIIHSALANDKYVETFSTGEEPYRYLTIAPKKRDI